MAVLSGQTSRFVDDTDDAAPAGSRPSRPAAIVMLQSFALVSGLTNLRLAAASHAAAVSSMDRVAATMSWASSGAVSPRAVTLASVVGDTLSYLHPVLMSSTDLIEPDWRGGQAARGRGGAGGEPTPADDEPGGAKGGRGVVCGDAGVGAECRGSPDPLTTAELAEADLCEPSGYASSGPVLVSSRGCELERRAAAVAESARRIVSAGGREDGGASEIARQYQLGRAGRRRGRRRRTGSAGGVYGLQVFGLGSGEETGGVVYEEWRGDDGAAEVVEPVSGGGGEGGGEASMSSADVGCGGGLVVVAMRFRMSSMSWLSRMAEEVAVARCKRLGLGPSGRLVVIDATKSLFPLRSSESRSSGLSAAAAASLSLQPWIRDMARGARAAQGCGDVSRLSVVHPRIEDDWVNYAEPNIGPLPVLGQSAIVRRSSRVLSSHRPQCLRVAMDESAVRPSVRRDLESGLLAAAPGARLMSTLAPSAVKAGAGAAHGSVGMSTAARAADALGGVSVDVPYAVVSAVEYDHAASAGSLLGHSMSSFDMVAAVDRLGGGDGASLESVMLALQRASSVEERLDSGRAAWRLDGGDVSRECKEGRAACLTSVRQSFWFRRTGADL